MKTIAAISTPVGVGGISVIRVSGKEAKNIASKVFSPLNVKNFDIEPRKMYLGDFKAEEFTEKYTKKIQKLEERVQQLVDLRDELVYKLLHNANV